MFLKRAVMKNLTELPGNPKIFQNGYSNISGWLLLWIGKCPKDISVLRIFNTLERLTFFHPLTNSLFKHPLINLVIKSNATCY